MKIPAKTLEKIQAADSIARDVMMGMVTAVDLLEAAYDDLSQAGSDDQELVAVAQAIELARIRHLTASEIRVRLTAFGIHPPIVQSLVQPV